MNDSTTSSELSAYQSREAYVKEHLNRNIAVQLTHGMFGQTGFRIFNAPTFLPVFLYSLSGSEFVVGLARSLQAFGQVITPMAGAAMIGHRRKTLRITLFYGALMRLQILLVALSGLLLGGHDAGIYAVVFFMCLMGLFQGMQGVMMNTLRARVIPVNRRGFVTGWRNFLAGGTTAGVSYFAGGYFIDNNLLGNGYATLFLLAFIITSVGLIALGFSKEPEADTVRQRQTLTGTIRALPELLRADPLFARFVLASALGTFGRMAMPFYILFATTIIPVSGTTLGALTTVWLLTGTASNLIWGSIADKNGYRIVMILTLMLWLVAHIQLIFAEGFLGILAFFVIVGTAVGGFNQARQNMVLEFGVASDIPMMVAVSNTAVNFIASVGPIIGGLIAFLLDYTTIFVICAITQLCALIIIVGWVPEPRYKPQ